VVAAEITASVSENVSSEDVANAAAVESNPTEGKVAEVPIEGKCSRRFCNWSRNYGHSHYPRQTRVFTRFGSHPGSPDYLFRPYIVAM
jgi:hypothetical protein